MSERVILKDGKITDEDYVQTFVNEQGEPYFRSLLIEENILAAMTRGNYEGYKTTNPKCIYNNKPKKNSYCGWYGDTIFLEETWQDGVEEYRVEYIYFYCYRINNTLIWVEEDAPFLTADETSNYYPCIYEGHLPIAFCSKATNNFIRSLPVK